jgi:RNA polymerase sigma-70 factor (ECF subfamily)
MTADPKALLNEARRGDDGALGRLLETYAPYLTILARVQVGRRLQRKVDPTDVVQETFLDAHRQFPQFRGTSEGELLAWLRRILAGQIALTLRKYLGTKGRDMNLERELAVQLDHSSQAMDRGVLAAQSTPSQHASKREQSVLLAEALGRLPESYREVIVLRYLEGLDVADVAARMGKTQDSVQKLWVRALANLRGALAGGQ